MNRETVLRTAQNIVLHDREQQYGTPEDCFSTIAAFWNAYIGGKPQGFVLQNSDVAAMMILLKIARQTCKSKADNWVDIAGYAACGAELDEITTLWKNDKEYEGE